MNGFDFVVLGILVNAMLDAPAVAYQTAAVHEVAAVPNKKQGAACTDLAANP